MHSPLSSEVTKLAENVVFLADVHGNLEALDRVLDTIERWSGSPEIVVLGDIVGYGPRPGECVDRLRSRDVSAVLGNHDAGVIGEMATKWFNSMAREANEWTRDRLSPDQLDYLRSLPRRITLENTECVHGSPSSPLTEYVKGARTATTALNDSNQQFLATGHTHVPALYEGPTGGRLSKQDIAPGEWIDVDPDRDGMVVNPGSVGQPRDGDPRASYLQWDRGGARLRWERVDYDVESTQSAIKEAGLPEKLATRLSIGV
jgi:diadenosine tetraphosphatase ApaH/serine/threonine PP2A family protein phosphatase